MPKHEFGIMQEAPAPGVRYDEYEPQRCRCIAVDDDVLLPFLRKFGVLRCYWHTTACPEFGLAYYGITLIPPESLGGMCEIIAQQPQLSELTALLHEAAREQKYVIHFGI